MTTTSLPPFSDDPCPKCGERSRTVQWNGQTAIWHDELPERITATCIRCGYSWIMLPKDATPEATANG